MLRADQLTSLCDDRPLFSALSLTVNRGEVVQISGANGVGKTTLLRLLTGLTQPESGTVYWEDKPLPAVRDIFHRQLLWLGHLPGVKSALTADENLHFFYPHSTRQTREAALAHIGLVGNEDILLSRLSAGQQRRVGLARLWLSDAALWILDEPLTALDVSAIEIVTRRLEHHAQRGGSVILTTHQPLRELACTARTIVFPTPEECAA